MHGGIISTLLYEVMENLAYRNGTVAMMRDLQVNFHGPAKIGKRITAVARLELCAGSEMSITATLVQNNLIAEGSANLVALSQEQIDRLDIT